MFWKLHAYTIQIQCVTSKLVLLLYHKSACPNTCPATHSSKDTGWLNFSNVRKACTVYWSKKSVHVNKYMYIYMKSRTMQWLFHIVTISYSNSSCSALSMTINLVCVEVPYCFKLHVCTVQGISSIVYIYLWPVCVRPSLKTTRYWWRQLSSVLTNGTDLAYTRRNPVQAPVT